jgi:hypothetical protein
MPPINRNKHVFAQVAQGQINKKHREQYVHDYCIKRQDNDIKFNAILFPGITPELIFNFRNISYVPGYESEGRGDVIFGLEVFLNWAAHLLFPTLRSLLLIFIDEL